MKLCLVCNFQFEDEQELCPKDYSKLVPLGKDQLIGKLIQDPSVYNNTDQMLVETRNLVKAIRENPKKYLTIHFRVF